MSAVGERKDIVDGLRFIAASAKASEAPQISIVVSNILETIADSIEEGAEEPLLYRLIAFASKEEIGDHPIVPPAKGVQ